MKFLYCEGRSEPNRAYLRTCDLEMIIVMSSNPHFVCRESMEKKEKLFVEGRDLYLVSKSYQVNLNRSNFRIGRRPLPCLQPW